MITPESSIPELLKIASHSFRECEINEVQQILMNREKMMKMELEDLRRDLDAMKTEARLQERSHSVADIGKLRIEEKLLNSERKCEELNEKIIRLSEEKKVTCDRAKRAEERHEKLSKEISNVTSEKNKLILDLNAKIKELQNKNLETEQYKQELDAKVAKLRAEKLASDQLVMELRRKQSEADQVMVELKRQNSEVTRSLDELRQEKMESDSNLENLAPRVMMMEAELATLFNVKVEDLPSLADFTDRFAPKGAKVDLPDIINRWKDTLTNDSTNVDAGNVATSNSTGSDGAPFVIKGSHDSVTRCPSKVSLSPFADREVIEICDSDDEAMPSGTKYTSDTSYGQHKRKKTLEKEKISQVRWHSSSESD